MDKGTMNAQMQGPTGPKDKIGGWAIDRPGQARESFGGGILVSDIR